VIAREGGAPSARRRRRRQRGSRRLTALAVFLAVAGVGFLASPAGAAGTSPSAATTNTSPVDLATPINFADGMAHRSAIIRSGGARIEVLSPTLLRLEYSPTGTFENDPTVNAIDRSMAVPPYSSKISGGWLTVRTAKAELRYKVGSGPFTTRNTSLQFTNAGVATTVHPTWEWECTFGQACQAGAATLTGGASLSQTEPGYQSTAGYVGYFFNAGAAATWQVLGSPAGPVDLHLRYSTYQLTPTVHAFDVLVNGKPVKTVTVPLTPTNSWTTLTVPASFVKGSNSVEVRCGTGEGCEANLDTLSVSTAGGPAPAAPSTDPLGGWIRGFDTATYNTTPACTPGQTAATCVAGLEPLHTDGLLDRAGWRLLDDTQSAVWNKGGWIGARPPHGDMEDGYLFVYGHNYEGALQTLRALTGPAPLLTRNIFGVWYSDYHPYSSADIENSVYATFVANDVPLNILSLDTDWKAPNNWDGWSWNPTLFPDPTSFLQWARAHGIDVTLNLHSSIADNDPKLATAQAVAGNTLASSTCTIGPCKVWDWSSIPQAESNFSLQRNFMSQGVSFWWLDWCCDDSSVSTHGATPDSWVDHLYAEERQNSGQRGFVLARLGSSNSNPEQVYPAGPWSNHTSTLAFTGDAWGTWNTLAREAELTSAESTIGQPYVSSDIGSFLGPPPSQKGSDPPDLYDRWVQFGTFQPILRLHSNDETRLPWQYPQPVRDDAEAFLRLRESLIPYTYTLASESNRTGLPMARPLYLDYPSQADAYNHPTEYLYGPDVLVSPVTTPGTTATTTVWFPPGRWTDYFTGATFSGPSTATVSDPLDRMPVFVRAGGIMTEQPANALHHSTSYRSLTVLDYPGAPGSFDLYGDAGTGLGYTKGQFTTTRITTTTNGSTTRLVVAPATGHYRGQARSSTYTIEMVDLSRPTAVTLNGAKLAEGQAQASGPSWTYDSSTHTVVIDAGPTAATRGLRVTETGGRLQSQAEPQ